MKVQSRKIENENWNVRLEFNHMLCYRVLAEEEGEQ